MSDSAFSDEYSEEFRRHEELDFIDRCAIAAMSGLCAGDTGNDFTLEQVVAWAWEAADMMLAERNRRRENRAN